MVVIVVIIVPQSLPLVSREWRNGVQLKLLLLPFFHSLLTKGMIKTAGSRVERFSETSLFGLSGFGLWSAYICIYIYIYKYVYMYIYMNKYISQ